MDRPSNRERQDVTRRRFIKTVGAAAVATASAPVIFDPRFAHAAPAADSAAETVIGQFYQTLNNDQIGKICLPFDHQLRRRISPNWHITEPLVGSDFYSQKQQALIKQIVKNVTSESGYERLMRQMDDDDGGIESYSVAMFGKPGEGKFQWELTGRHLTLRADGDSVDRAAFGGPVIYGHGEPDPKENLFYYQTIQANKVFQALDPKQAKQALVKKAPQESAVKLQDKQGQFPGIPVSQLSDDQKQLVQDTIKLLLDPYRSEDVEEVMAILKANGGADSLRMAFYQQEDLNDDKEWDIWRVEGPGFVWHFRGAPHVHAFINIGIV
ncbi:MAG: DUF3500 domain-containing protein [Planctomycetaceae bacterium]|nr:DUF3500 domain-containing protein [Planctomycetaceae bacterium]